MYSGLSIFSPSVPALRFSKKKNASNLVIPAVYDTNLQIFYIHYILSQRVHILNLCCFLPELGAAYRKRKSGCGRGRHSQGMLIVLSAFNSFSIVYHLWN
jgi:hypothetical protein